MSFINSLNNLPQKEQYKFIILLFSVMLILAIPFLFVNVVYNFHLYIIFSGISAFLLSFKFTGIINTFSEKFRTIMSFIVFAIAPFLIVFFIAPVLNTDYIMKNFFIVAIPYLLIFFIFRNSQVSIISISVFCFLINTINEILLILRGTTLTISDIFALDTALTVASNYSLKINQNIYYSFLCLFMTITLAYIFPLKLKDIKSNKVKTTTLIAVIVTFVTSVYFTSYELINYNFLYNFGTDIIVNERGICYNLIANLVDGFKKAPDGYSREKAENILNTYHSETGGKSPNIIIIMNESFSDITKFLDIQSTEDVMPFYHSLDKNVTKGMVVSSVFGGGTCNAEFEFLTGMTMTFLPSNSYPYLQYINDDIYTINSSLNSDIYEKTYIHPYIASNWNRSTVYPFLGFDKFYDGLKFSMQNTYTEEFKNKIDGIEYEGVKLTRGYIGDDVTYDKVIELYENKPNNKKTIQFVVTMQNHSPYDYEGDNFENTVHSGTDSRYLDQYLSLIKISDTEIKRLIEYFSNEDEETVIVFFGDHLPMIANNIISSNTNHQNDTLDKYSTPFFIWTNFESETEYIDYVSLNYLSLLMKDKAGISLDSFDMFRKELYSKYPVFSTNIIIDNEENIYYDYSLIDDSIITEYEYLQHYFLFDN